MMPTSDNEHDPGGIDGNEYDSLLALEELESLLEELEEAGIEGDLAAARLPADTDRRVREAGVDTTDALRTKIARMHAQLDQEIIE